MSGKPHIRCRFCDAGEENILRHVPAWQSVIYMPGPGPWLWHNDVEWSAEDGDGYYCVNCGRQSEDLGTLAYIDADDPRIPPELRKEGPHEQP